MSVGKSTKTEQFGGRVHGLRQIYKRIEEETYPLPSSYDVTNYLTYFHQILLGLVKEAAPEIAKDGSSFNHEEIVILDYTGLFTTLVDLLHVIQHVGEGHEDCGLTILHIMVSLVPFLPENWLNDLPITLTTMMTSVSSSLHGYIMNILCGYLLPLLLDENNGADSKLHGKICQGGLSLLFSELIELSPPDKLVDCYALQCSSTLARSE
ncbi:Hypothetical predicted protein [Paramuricea clavata]|uniref:Uncharacterized protein n=1 Tax=Paramuricea clavata TaxID=317549 RepID=A0A6S7IQD8_PARCT|nr:Hypothetical predicted protein [Paramuricea clavata]